MTRTFTGPNDLGAATEELLLASQQFLVAMDNPQATLEATVSGLYIVVAPVSFKAALSGELPGGGGQDHTVDQ